MPRFVIVGRTATASPEFLLDDLPGTSGRLDVLLRCVRAALLTSHGVRHGTKIDLVLGGGPLAPRVVRIDGATVKFLRPDERPIATLLKKSLAAFEGGDAFVEVRPGISIAAGGLERALREREAEVYVLEEGGIDIRAAEIGADAIFVIGDHLGFDDDARSMLATIAKHRISVGPTSLHSDDVVALVMNEVDRALSLTS